MLCAAKGLVLLAGTAAEFEQESAGILKLINKEDVDSDLL
jgi:hypothetical protein